MKECPKCGTVYTDDTLSFCLSDGTSLVFQINGEKTEKFSNLVIDVKTDDSPINKTIPTNIPTEQTIVHTDKKNRVSPMWILATFGLLGVVLISVLSVWLFSDKLFGNNNIVQKDDDNSNIQNQNLSTPVSNQNKQISKPTVEKTSSPTPTEKLYRVVGVKSNDVLYIRPNAGNLKVEIGKIPPNATGIRVVGTGKRVGKNLWLPINYNGIRGWVNSRFISLQK